MERSKYYYKRLIFFILLTLISNAISSETAYRNIVYNAYITGDLTKWVAVINTIEKNGETKTVTQKLELINYYYGYIGYLLGSKKYEQAEKMIDKGDKLIKETLALDNQNPTANAYKGSFIGFRIALSKFKAITLGPESASYINKAYEKDKNNVQAIVDKANIYYYTPSLFGGNKNEAIKFYKQGISLIEKSGDTEHNWFYLSVLTALAKAYEKINKPHEALSVYRNILKIEPQYHWVKNELYPALLKKVNS